MNLSGLPGTITTLEAWRLFRVTPGEVHSPAELSGRVPDWSGRSLSPDIARLAREPNVDAFEWWLLAALPNAAAGKLLLPEVNGIADLWIDQKKVIRLDNAFVRWEVPLPNASGVRELAIQFLALDQLLLEKKPRPRWSTALVKHQQLRWMRQPLAGRLRGWSERNPAVGLGKPVRFGAGEAHARVQVRAGVVEGIPRLEVRCPSGVAGGLLRIRIAGREYSAVLSGDESAPGAGAIDVQLPGLDLWMPHTHGQPVLHALEVFLDNRRVLETSTGFRIMTIDRETGAFVINGRRIFARGASCLEGGDATPASLIELAVRGGFNLIRLPGTGGYASTELLSRCDRAGVLLWQDLPFASMDYPDTPEFIEGVLRELDDRLPDFGSHPSLAVVCGGSDIDQQAVYHGLTKDRRLPGALRTHLAERVATLLPQIPFVTNTPSGGDLATHTDRGFSSYFGIGAYRRPLDDRSIDRVRFATECLGFANVPDAETLRTLFADGEPAVTTPVWKQGVPRDSGTGWDFDDVRDHYTEALFRVNCRELRFQDNARYLELSRISSGVAMSMTMSRWRAAESRCNGALVWTLNDVAPGSGWGLIDHLGRPKAAWYQLRRVCQPVQVLLTDEGLDGHHLHLINERSVSVAGELEVMLLRPDGRRGAGKRIPVELQPGSVSMWTLDGLFGQFQDTTWAHRFGPQGTAAVAVRLVVSGPDGQGPGGVRSLLDESFEVIGVGGQLLNVDSSARVRATSSESADGMRLVIESDRLLQWVCVDAPGWSPEDNYFHVLPGVPRTLTLVPLVLGTSRGKPRIKPANTAGSIPIESHRDAS